MNLDNIILIAGIFIILYLTIGSNENMRNLNRRYGRGLSDKKMVSDVQRKCERIHEANRLIPYITWGSTSQPDQEYWDSNGCNQRMCSYWKRKYNIIPYQSWGSMPDDFKESWDNPNMNCNTR